MRSASLILSLLMFCSQARASSSSGVIAAVPAAMPPPLVYEKEGKLSGIVPEYTEVLLEFLGRKGSMMLLPRNRLINYLSQGRVDFLCYTNKEWTAEREFYNWSVPLFVKREVILGAAPMPKRLSDFKGKTLGTMLGYSYPKLDDDFKNKIVLREDGPSEESNLNKLLNKHIAYVIIDEIYLDYYKKTHPSIDMGRERFSLQHYTIGCSISKNGSVTEKELNRAIHKLKESKKLEVIFKKYGVSFYPAD